MLKNYLEKINIEPTEEILSNFQNFTNLLLEWNEKINLTRITMPKEIELKHYIDSLSIFKTGKIKENVSIIDVGCGAGFPSFPIKLAFPNCDISLLDSLNKRVIFQNEVIKTLNLKRITTIHSRAEEGGQNEKYREKFDIATARAVASLPCLIEICIPFLKVGGYFIALKGTDANEEIINSKNALEQLNAQIEDVYSFNLADTEHKRTIIVIKKTGATPLIYPRNAPKPIKQPL